MKKKKIEFIDRTLPQIQPQVDQIWIEPHPETQRENETPGLHSSKYGTFLTLHMCFTGDTFRVRKNTKPADSIGIAI